MTTPGRTVLAFIVGLWLAAAARGADAGRFNVLDLGAKGDGRTLDTEAIQGAIDQCNLAGGGQVVFPPARYLVGTLYLKTNVGLYLEAGATLLGSTDKSHYTERAILYAAEQDNIAILGRGTINGQGGHPVFKPANAYNGQPGRPFIMQTVDCTRVRVEGVTLRDGATWTYRCERCDHVTIDGLSIISRVNANNDGVDLVDCHKVHIANSYFDCGDDAICPKSETARGCRYLTIANCVIKSESNAIKCGTASVGGFEDMAISNCTIFDTRLSGIALEAVDGGTIDRVVISNITMNRVNGGIFLRLGKRHTEKPGALRNVTISNVQATGVGSWRHDASAAYFKETRDPRIGLSIMGLPGHPVENVTLQNIRIRYEGGGSAEDAARELEEKPDSYPEYSMFGVTPAYGFTCRHVRSIKFLDVELEREKDDARPALFFDDARDITIAGFNAAVSPSAPAMIRLRNVDGAFVHNCRPDHTETAFVSLEGPSTNNVSILGNDLSRVQSVIRRGDDVPEEAVHAANNRLP